MDKVAIFMDGGYIEKTLIHQFAGLCLRYDAFAARIADRIGSDVEIFRTYFFHCLPYKGNPPTEEESVRYSNRERFFNALRRNSRFDVQLGRLRRIGPDPEGNYTYEQKMVDALLSLNLVKLSAKGIIQHAALVAGDGDFVPAVRAAKEDGVNIWLFHGSSRHNALWETADERVELTEEFLLPCRLNSK